MIVHIRDGLCVLRLYLDLGIDHRYNFKYLPRQSNTTILNLIFHNIFAFITY